MMRTAAFLLLGTFSVFGRSSAVEPQSLRPQIDGWARQVIDAGEAKGLVVGIQTPEGREFFAYGQARDDSDAAPDEHTLFEIGSVTKTFTALALAEMAARDELSLSDPVAKLLPPEVEVPKRGEGEITLEHLATHTSGLPRLPGNFAPADPLDPYADYTAEKMYEYLGQRAKRKGRSDPSWSYSNLGVGLLGHALALRAGKTYEEMIAERVLRPLGLDETTITLSAEQASRFAQPHDADGEPCKPWSLDALAGAGAIRSSADDVLDYLAAHAGLRETPLAKAIAETTRPRVPIDDHSQSGLAWIVTDKGQLSHSGQTGGYHSAAFVWPEKKVAVVALGNQASAKIDELAYRAMLAAAGEEPPPLATKPIVEVPRETLDQYAGRYKLDSGLVFTISARDGKLFAQLTGQPEYRVYPESRTRFFYKVVDAQLTFERGPEGKISGLILHQNGDHSAPRVPDSD